MGKALLGTRVDPSTLRLLDEVRSLRARVAELEAALEAATAADAGQQDTLDVTDREPADA